MVKSRDESEWRTRKELIDPRLDAKGWVRAKPATARMGPSRVEELETDHGPADYALVLDGVVVGIVEAKNLTVDPQGTSNKAERHDCELRLPDVQ